MDLDEWELLPSDAFLDLHQDGSKNNTSLSPDHQKGSVIDMNYFQKLIDPPQKSQIPVLDEEEKAKTPDDDQSLFEEKIDQETISQHVFFKSLKENEFADMKLDSPKSPKLGFLPQTEKFDGKFVEEEAEEEEEEIKPMKKEKESSKKEIEKEIVDWENDDEKDGGLDIWKWAMTGIGAVFAFGFAAATVSLIVLGNRHKERSHHKNPVISFQFSAHEKRIKQVVDHAKKLNDAFSAVRGGAPLTRAHITIGGYYEGL